MIKGPFSYSGNKYRIWNKYLKPVMHKYQCVHEPFIGSGVCIYNSNGGGQGRDINPHVVVLHNVLKDPGLMDRVLSTYAEYFPEGCNAKDSYNKLRDDLNVLYMQHGLNNENAHMLYILIQMSFNSLFRFSSKGFNAAYVEKPFDPGRIEQHIKIAQDKNIDVVYGSYETLDLSKVDKQKDIIYFDPPYVASKFQYGGWTDQDEHTLLAYITMLDKEGYSFILSNTFAHRGETNDYLIEWSKAFNTYLIDMSYNAWAARVKAVEREDTTVEVIVTNINGAFPELVNAHDTKYKTDPIF